MAVLASRRFIFPKECPMRTAVRVLLPSFVLFVLSHPALAAWRAEGPYLGVVNDLSVDPSNPSVVYAATSSGGVWRSDDGGATWALPGGDLTSRKMNWVEVDPTNAATVWAGEDDPGEPALWRSTDRGATWKLVQGPVKGELNSMQPVGQRIAFAPSQPSLILVPSTNLHYRSNDGGKTWTDFRVPGQDAYAFAIDPKDAKILYAGGRGEKHQFSRSQDGGKTWKAAGAGLPETSIKILTVDSRAPETLYAVSGFGDLWRSRDRGDNWEQIASPVEGTDDITNFAVDPTDANVLWAANENGLSRSDDGGETWHESDRGMGRYVCRDVAFDPRKPGAMLAATAGNGVYRSADGGSSWKASREGLAAGWVTRIYVPPLAGPWFAQASVGLYRHGDGGWTEIQAPFTDKDEAELDGMLFESANPKAAWAFATAKAWRSADGGTTWRELEKKEIGLRDMMKGNMETEQFNSLALDPANPKIIWAGSWSNDQPGYAVFKSIDGGKTWKPSGKGLPAEAVKLLVAAAPGTLYALSGTSDLYRSSDGGGSWSAAKGAWGSDEVRTIAADPASPGRVYVAGKEHLYRSTDSGASWTAVKLEEDVESVVVSPQGVAYAGAFHGVFKSADGGDTWTAVGAGLPNSDVRALAIGGSPPRLYAGIAGGSVWSTELP
jgi:photosystem II stability/assembly factor-like uncharacterized protein